ncbi:E3 37.9 kDa protein [California sea lion adenovirus 1]|uniref:E3 37.9 kDa protein n=1 Tax=California sea lion adenovirus 1 TaxID=943083 RepID=A0A059XJ50_9ADEN|nr:E3 37.9 kDa protein [California sea lion adenovirus 1]AIA22364.1 E3 37.9 kDa protein [California sea lion adenovirus 1]
MLIVVFYFIAKSLYRLIQSFKGSSFDCIQLFLPFGEVKEKEFIKVFAPAYYGLQNEKEAIEYKFCHQITESVCQYGIWMSQKDYTIAVFCRCSVTDKGVEIKIAYSSDYIQENKYNKWDLLNLIFEKIQTSFRTFHQNIFEKYNPILLSWKKIFQENQPSKIYDPVYFTLANFIEQNHKEFSIYLPKIENNLNSHFGTVTFNGQIIIKEDLNDLINIFKTFSYYYKPSSKAKLEYTSESDSNSENETELSISSIKPMNLQPKWKTSIKNTLTTCWNHPGFRIFLILELMFFIWVILNCCNGSTINKHEDCPYISSHQDNL